MSQKPILEYNSGGAIVARNVYGKWIDEILMRTDPSVNGGAAFYYQQDRNGNVTHLTNASGAVIEKYKYDAFAAVTVYDGAGNVRPAGTAYKNRFLFTGSEPSEWGHREIDGQVREGSGRAERERTSQYAATFGFYEYRARAYNPVDAGDYNLFRYVHNDPLDRVDPMGLDGMEKEQFLTKPGDQTTGQAQMVLPIGSNIPVLAVRLNAQWVDYRAAGASVEAKFYVRQDQLTLVDRSRNEALAVRMESGKGPATNMPEAEALKNEGPLPRGSYRILSRTQGGSQLYKNTGFNGRIDSNEKTPSGCLGRGVKGFIASMKRTPWRGVLKNECNESSGSFGASAWTLQRAGQRGPEPLVG